MVGFLAVWSRCKDLSVLAIKIVIWFGLECTLHRWFLLISLLCSCACMHSTILPRYIWQIFWVFQWWNRGFHLNDSSIRKTCSKESHFVDNAEKFVKKFLDSFLFFPLLHLKFSNQIQHLHPFYPLVSFIILLQEILKFTRLFLVSLFWLFMFFTSFPFDFWFVQWLDCLTGLEFHILLQQLPKNY